VATAARAEELRQGVCAETRLLEATDAGPGWTELDESPDEPPVPPQVADGDLAYILYTSGSTGRPKGVCISHGNALAFVRWAVEAIGAREDDRFSNHAPFHFDLSVLDLYAAFSVGARVCIVGDEAAYMAEHLLAFLESERITVWYSVPSAILLMMDRGGLLEAPPTLRALLFAGEPFPVKHLRRIREAWPGVAMWNLYGPTETNVCTAYRVDAIAGDQADIPIGRATCGDRVWLKRGDGTEVPACAAEGELVVAGPTVFLGYWGQPAREGAPYATGDMVRADADGLLHYIGRRDHMVKLRGFRVELGEVEAALLGHAAVKEAAAIVLGEGLVARLVAVLGVGDEPAPTLLDVKRHCAIRLPRYMIPDDLQAMPALPRTGNGKVDRQALLGALKQSR
jgi:amino acid adenylation domain-containing protein